MSLETVTRRYATALADVVLHSGETETVKNELKSWEDMINSSVELKAAFGNCEGWTGMLCALKVYLEHGINLREGTYK